MVRFKTAVLCAMSFLLVFAACPLMAENIVKVKEKSAASSFTLFVAGDVCPAYNIQETHWKSPGFFSPEAQAIVSSHDMSVMNYETATDHKGAVPRKKKFVFRASPESPRGLNFFTCAVTANNHAFDYGEKGWEATAAALSGAGMPHNGVFAKKNGYSPFVFEKNGWKIVLVTGTIWGSALGKYSTLSPNGIEGVLKKLPPKLPLERRIVYIHGDEEYKKKTARQESWSKRFTDSGADIVLWAHSHTYGPVEYHGKSLVAYGLGNFLFGGNSGWRNRKNIESLSFKFTNDGKTEWKKLFFEAQNYRMIPAGTIGQKK